MKDIKEKLRKNFLALRDSAYTDLKDKKIQNLFLNSDLYRQCKSIFTYVNMGSEVETKMIIRTALDDKKIVAVPKILNNKNMIFVRITSFEDLKLGKFNILEPISTDEIESDFETVFLIPALAFDIKNYRLGYGGGYYDRYLKDSVCLKKVGLAYSFQIVDSLPTDKHDIPVDIVITD